MSPRDGGLDEADGDVRITVRKRRWIFGQVILDERSMELRVDGCVVALEPKAREVLRYLLQNAGQVVTKRELLEYVWPGRYLSASVLPKHISALRRALRDPKRRLVRTAHSYGYRLDATVSLD